MRRRRLRPQLALKELAHADPVRQPGQLIVPGEILYPRLRLYLESDIRRGAPVADDPFRRNDGFNGDMAVTLVAHRRKVAAVQQSTMACLAGQRDPLRQRLIIRLHKCRYWTSQPGRDTVPGNARKTIGEPGKMQVSIRLPDPVRGGFSHVAKAALAGGKGVATLGQQKGILIIHTCFFEHVATQNHAESAGRKRQQDQQRQDVVHELPPRIFTFPLEGYLMAINGQRRYPAASCQRRGILSLHARLRNAVLFTQRDQLFVIQHVDKHQSRGRAGERGDP